MTAFKQGLSPWRMLYARIYARRASFSSLWDYNCSNIDTIDNCFRTSSTSSTSIYWNQSRDRQNLQRFYFLYTSLGSLSLLAFLFSGHVELWWSNTAGLFFFFKFFGIFFPKRYHTVIILENQNKTKPKTWI